MTNLNTLSQPSPSLRPGRCYDCFRPHCDCFCAAIPSIDNRTEVLILQHKRERFHPFNTARIVRRALRNSNLLVGSTPELAQALALKPRAGLLYPGPESMLISDLPPQERPEQLVILDGTWHHAKTMVRDIPALRELPRYRLAPAEPSRYRIRREPNAAALSTVEAVVAALGMLEPETHGLDQLLDAFLTMVNRQANRPKSSQGHRIRKRRRTTGKNIPSALLGDLRHVVVVYGESASREPGRERAPRLPVSWVAERLGTGEQFGCLIQPQFPLQDTFLKHLELGKEDFLNALSLDEARSRWKSFLHPEDCLTVFNSAVARLSDQLNPQPVSCLELKSVDFSPRRRYGKLDDIVLAEKLQPAPALHFGRAGQRLANLAAFARHLHALANLGRVVGE